MNLNNIPITFHNSLVSFTEKTRPMLMREYAANGAKHLVMTDGLFIQLMQDIHYGVHDNDFTGTPYVPVYAKLPVCFSHLLLLSFCFCCCLMAQFRLHKA